METIRITRKKFTENMEACFKMIEKGNQIIITWGENKALISPAEQEEDDTIYTHREWENAIEESLAQYKSGNYAVMTDEKWNRIVGV
ncbi:MAG: hypothetical protein LBU37_02655 [Tannerellaceae bacterium]|jgi:hypothetical protein|nr:hypothetical protein [Tannerellaceae bacterium]